MESLRLNAFTGAPPASSEVHADYGRWAGKKIGAPDEILRGPPPLEDLSAWKHPDVGWGLVLPDDPALDPAAKATAADAPEPIQRLLAHREGVVLRWSEELSATKVRRYFEDGSAQDPHIVLSERGNAKGRVPRYLLLYGAPTVLPWDLQFRLNASAYVGRLDLEGDALRRYVDAVVAGWDGQAADASRAVTWAVDHGGDDITRLMRTVVAKKVHGRFAEDDAMTATFVDGRNAEATGQVLIDALADQRPGMIVTTSHGRTGPLDDVDAMRASLGVPVDGSFQDLDRDALLDRWRPDGAIWYAHACCSAGADGSSGYEGLVDEGSQAAQVLEGVAACGAMVAPLPRLLLGAERPLRAFLGHVEPTFDWTLKDQSTGQVLTNTLADALYNRLYQPFPLGRAFEVVHDKAPQLEIARNSAIRKAKREADPVTREAHLHEALTCRLVAQDLQSLVLLGDPAEMPHLG